MRLGYQPRLDGLRAVAIVLVISIHLSGEPPGGYMGVDLFFVLSGFLITTLLLEERQIHGSVSLSRFYARRALRLFPALWVFLFVSLAKKIAPDGEDITGVGFTAIAAGATREVELRRPRKDMPSPEPLGLRPVEHAPGAPVTVTGRLEFASKLNQQSEIRIEPDDGGPPQRVRVPEGMMNDIVKPLWDERVTIRGTRQGDEILLLTIDPAE